jgi:hypothetical protein
MPYIRREIRASYAEPLEKLGGKLAYQGVPSGVLNYVITELVLWWLGKSPNYTRFNEAIGVLECAKLELYRRAVAPYEDQKRKENGDVY